MSKNKIHLEKGVAYRIKDGKRIGVSEIPDFSPCDCELDCCLQAIKLKDHANGVVKYIYILNDTIAVGTLDQLKSDSTIL